MEIPENFRQIITDMTEDLSKTFPEYSEILYKWTDNQSNTFTEHEIKKLFDYSLSVYPERFFDIINQDDSIFDKDEINTSFLPGIDFSTLFKSNGISDNNRKVMWNYLKLVLLTIVSTIKDKSSFGNANNIFDDVDENDLFSKLSETMESMTDFFQKIDDIEGPASSFQVPKVDDIFGHLKGLFDGKLGNLVKELAEEISGNLADVLGKDDMNDVRSTKDVISKLMQNPQKIAGLFQTVNDKLQNKLKSGEISHEELFKEATEVVSKMKGKDGEFDFQEMFKNMGNGGGDINNMIKKMGLNLFNNFPGKNESEDTERHTGNGRDKEKEILKAKSRASIHEKMKNKILIKKIQEAELQLKEQLRITEASEKYVPYDESTFTIDGGEMQSKSKSEPTKKNKKKSKK